MTRRIRLILLILTVSLMIGPLSACGNSGGGASIRYDISAAVSSLDPQYAYSDAAKLIVRNAFEGLFVSDSEGNALPAAAESMTLSSDGLTATVRLREGLRWSDGSALTASDFEFALRRLFTPGYPSAYASDFMCLQNAAAVLRGSLPPSALGVRAEDERTLILRLAYPVENLPHLLCSTAAMPCKASFFEEQRGRYGLERELILYNGPFQVYYWEEDFVQLRQNEFYWGAESVQPARVTFDVQPESARLSRYEAGQTDAAVLSFEEWNSLSRKERHAVEQYEDTVWVLIFNQRDPLFEQPAARRALAHSIDQRLFAPNLGYDLMETNVFLPPTLRLNGESYRKLAGFSGPDRYDPGEAKADMRQVFWPGEQGKLTLLAPEDDVHPLTASAIQKCWRDTLALTANVKLLPIGELAAEVEKGAYQVAILPLQPDSPDPGAMLATFQSASASNPAGYSSEDYDALLERGQAARNQHQSLEAYRRAEELLGEDAVLVPLYYQTHYYVTAPGVEGIQFSPFAGETSFRAATKR